MEASQVGGAQGQAYVVSNTPGRLRVRVRKEDRQAGVLPRLRSHLESQEGVREVTTNPGTGSVTIKYDRQSRSDNDLVRMIADAGVVLMDTLSELSEPVPTAGPSTTAAGVQAAFSDLDRRIAAFTGHKVDMKLLFPATLGAIGLRQLFTTGLGISQVPAYVLLWYAFDSFWKMHHTHEATPAAGGNGSAGGEAAEAAVP